MAYLFNGASTHHIDRADAILQSWPITLHGRIRLPNSGDGLTHAILGFWEAASNNGFRILVELNGGVMKARCGSKAGGVASSATTTNSIGDSNWHSVVGEITAANARQVWLDNAGNGSNATSLTPGTLTKTTIGSIDNGGSYSSGAGHELADIAAWAGTLTADERAALAAGVSPSLIRPDILKLYAPLIASAIDCRADPFTVTGATVVDHPRVYMPARASAGAKAGAIIGPVGTASETDSALSLAAVQKRATGLAVEADAALALAGVSIRATGTSLETDLALNLAAVQIKATGAALETDTALVLSSARPAGLATETDSALALVSGAGAPVGQANETDTALALAGKAIKATGLATQTETALALAGVAVRAAGLAVETDAALALGSARPVGFANDNEGSLALGAVSAKQCGTSLETGTALALAGAQLRLVGLASETDTAFALSSAGTSVGISTEIDTAFALQVGTAPTSPDRRIASIRNRVIVGNARAPRTIVSATRKAAA